jgi:hypothetical protein
VAQPSESDRTLRKKNLSDKYKMANTRRNRRNTRQEPEIPVRMRTLMMGGKRRRRSTTRKGRKGRKGSRKH